MRTLCGTIIAAALSVCCFGALAAELDGNQFSGSWGWADAAHTIPMTARTVIDMASVTKVAAGVTAFLVAHAKGIVDFDVPFTNVLHSYRAPLQRSVTIRDLATMSRVSARRMETPASIFRPMPKPC